MKTLPAALVAASCVLALGACNKQPQVDPRIKQVMEQRHEGFEAIGEAFKTLNDAVKSGAGLTDDVKKAAHTIEGYAPQLADWFPPGSGPETGIDTEARAEIWQKPEEFAEKREAFAAEAARLGELADGGDAAAFAAQVKELGGRCKACHDRFRIDQD